MKMDFRKYIVQIHGIVGRDLNIVAYLSRTVEIGKCSKPDTTKYSRPVNAV